MGYDAKWRRQGEIFSSQEGELLLQKGKNYPKAEISASAVSLLGAYSSPLRSKAE